MKILLADGRSKVRFALRVLLERRTGLKVVAEIDNAKDLLRQIEATLPDVILLDWELAGLEQTDLPRLIQKINPEVKIVVLSGNPKARQQSQEVGINIFVEKSEPPERLLQAIGWQGNQ